MNRKSIRTDVINAIDYVYEGVNRTKNSREPLTCSEWAERHFVLPKETGEGGRWRSLPYQVGILDMLGASSPRDVTLLKSAKVGYTRMLTATAGYLVSYRNRNVTVYQPTDGDAKDFAKTDVLPMTRDVPALASLVDQSENAKRDVTLNRFKLGSNLLYVLGATSSQRFRRTTVDCVIYDELDGFERDIEGEGDPLTLGERGLMASVYPKSIRGTTPTTHKLSLIERDWDECDIQLSYWIPCSSCGIHQPLEWSHIVFDKGDIEDRARSAKYECKYCNNKMTYGESLDAQDEGYWSDGAVRLVKHEGIDPSLESLATGDEVPMPRHVGMRIWSAYSHFYSWTDLVREYLQSINDRGKLQAVTNQRFGELWRDDDVEVDEHEVLDARETFDVLPDNVQVVTCGVDVQKDRVELLAVGWAKDYQSWILDHRIFYGETDKYTNDPYKQLNDYLSTKKFERIDGASLSIDMTLIDSGYNSDTVYRYTMYSRVRNVHPLKGTDSIGAALVKRSGTGQIIDGRKLRLLFLLGTDIGKELTLHRLNRSSESVIHVPHWYTEDLAKQLTAERRVIKRLRGYDRKMWEKVHTRNEQLDMMVYALAALIVRSPVWETLNPKIEVTDEADDEPKRKVKISVPNRRSRVGGYVGSWKA